MEPQSIFNAIVAGVMAVIGWFARELWTAAKEFKSDLAKLREELPKVYVTKDDFREDMREIKNMLGKIFDKLENKADK